MQEIVSVIARCVGQGWERILNNDPIGHIVRMQNCKIYIVMYCVCTGTTSTASGNKTLVQLVGVWMCSVCECMCLCVFLCVFQSKTE